MTRFANHSVEHDDLNASLERTLVTTHGDLWVRRGASGERNHRLSAELTIRIYMHIYIYGNQLEYVLPKR